MSSVLTKYRSIERTQSLLLNRTFTSDGILTRTSLQGFCQLAVDPSLGNSRSLRYERLSLEQRWMIVVVTTLNESFFFSRQDGLTHGCRTRSGKGKKRKRGEDANESFFMKTRKFVCQRIIGLQLALDKVRIIYDTTGLHYHRR